MRGFGGMMAIKPFYKNYRLMKDLIVIMAKLMPVDEILDNLEKAIRDYKASPSGKEKSGISMYAMLWTTKEALGEKDPLEMITELNRMEKGSEILNPAKN